MKTYRVTVSVDVDTNSHASALSEVTEALRIRNAANVDGRKPERLEVIDAKIGIVTGR